MTKLYCDQQAFEFFLADCYKKADRVTTIEHGWNRTEIGMANVFAHRENFAH